MEKEKNKTDIKKLFILGGIVLLILAVLFALASYLKDYGGSKKKSVTEEGLFYQVNSDSVEDFNEFANGVAMLTNNTVQYLDASGNLMATNPHTFTDPAMYISGKNLLLYDKGGNSLRIEKNSSIFKEKELSAPITCAALGKYRNYAYSLNEDAGYQSHVYVCTYTDKVLFEWGSASDYCLNMRLSNDGKKLAVSVIGVDNAEYYSRVLLFDIAEKKQLYEAVFDEKTVYKIDFINSRELAVFTDSGLFRTSEDGSYEPIYEYTSAELNNVCLSENGFKIISISPYGNEQTPTVVVFNKKYQEIFRHEYESAISDVFCNRGYVCVAQNDVIKVINKENSLIGNFRLDEKCENVVLIGRNIFLLTASGISKFDVSYRNTNADPQEEVTKKISVAETTQEESTTAEETTAAQAETQQSVTEETVGNNEDAASLTPVGNEQTDPTQDPLTVSETEIDSQQESLSESSDMEVEFG